MTYNLPVIVNTVHFTENRRDLSAGCFLLLRTPAHSTTLGGLYSKLNRTGKQTIPFCFNKRVKN